MINRRVRNGVVRGLSRTSLIPKLVDWPTTAADPTPALADPGNDDSLFQERAAIREFDGGLSRADAEYLAARDCARGQTARD